MWILQNNFCQEWEFTPTCFYKCCEGHDTDQRRRLDYYAIHEVGEEPAKYGYVKMEGEGEVNMIAFCCDTKEMVDFIHGRIGEAILNHPDVLDLRSDKFNEDIPIL